MTSSAPSSEFSAVPTAGDRLGLAELEARLEEFLFAAPSHRSATLIAEGLAALSRDRQDFALRWAEVAAQSYTELGYQVAMLAPRALERMPCAQAEAWVLAALELFDKHGGRAAMDFLRDIDGFLLRCERGDAVAPFEAAEARLTRFLQGLAGRPLRVEASSDGTSWTDTETVHLPASIADRPTRDANLAQFRLRAAMLWGQAYFGTFNADLDAALAAWPERTRALGWLSALEAVRIEGCIVRELPGLGREIAQARDAWPARLAAVAGGLGAGEARIEDTLRVLDALRRDGAADREPPAVPHAGRLDPEAARRVRAGRIERETAIVRRAMRAVGRAATDAEAAPAIEIDATAVDGVEIRLDGEAIALPPAARAALRSLVQDLGQVPPEALVPAGPAPWVPGAAAASTAAPSDAGAADHLYDEWDFRRNAFRAGWCHLYEHRVTEGDREYVPAVRRKHRALIAQLRRRFEALRGEDRVLRRQPDGEEIDLDALVAARSDRRAGATVSPNLFSRRVRSERSLAVMFMVDMSGSTQGWINDAEREALVMLGEAVETLGDAWAIYGFSGWTRTRCDLYRVKSFDEPFDEAAERRVAAISARDYTRMGVAIRHLTGLLAAQPVRHRLLVTLSDGKPDDFADEYRSRYGIEDTRHALLEARARGVRSYCVTIDRNGADYLRHLYGPARYTVLDDVRKLPLRIADIYRRLAT